MPETNAETKDEAANTSTSLQALRLGGVDEGDEDEFEYSRRLRRFHSNERGQRSQHRWDYYDPYYTADMYYLMGTPMWNSYYYYQPIVATPVVQVNVVRPWWTIFFSTPVYYQPTYFNYGYYNPMPYYGGAGFYSYSYFGGWGCGGWNPGWGWNNGWNNGYANGWNNGYWAGYNQGYYDGYNNGYYNGYNGGYYGNNWWWKQQEEQQQTNPNYGGPRPSVGNQTNGQANANPRQVMNTGTVDNIGIHAAQPSTPKQTIKWETAEFEGVKGNTPKETSTPKGSEWGSVKNPKTTSTVTSTPRTNNGGWNAVDTKQDVPVSPRTNEWNQGQTKQDVPVSPRTNEWNSGQIKQDVPVRTNTTPAPRANEWQNVPVRPREEVTPRVQQPYVSPSQSPRNTYETPQNTPRNETPKQTYHPNDNHGGSYSTPRPQSGGTWQQQPQPRSPQNGQYTTPRTEPVKQPTYSPAPSKGNAQPAPSPRVSSPSSSSPKLGGGKKGGLSYQEDPDFMLVP